MNRILRMALDLLHLFGSLLVYWAVLLAWGVKPAIAATLLFVVADAAWRLWRRTKLPPLWLLSSGAAIVFGAIDLWAQTPFMIRYEGAVINLVTALAFAVGAFGREPLVMRFAQQRGADAPWERPEVIRFFRAFTLAWSLYFVARAAAFLWIMNHFALTEAIAARTVVGWVSLGIMLLISINGRLVFMACRRVGLFRPVPEAGT